MRSKSEFNELVYKKAKDEAVRIKKKRIAAMRGISAVCICLVIGGTVIYSRFSGNDAANEAMVCDGVQENGNFMYYSLNESAHEGKSAPMSVADVADDLILNDGAAEAELQTAGGYGVIPFSFEEELENHLNNNSKYGCARGSEKILAKKAVEIATQKCTVEYDIVKVYFDYEKCVWKIAFYMTGTVGGCQDVYLSGNGDLIISVYGE